ncbi:MAG: 5'/3'-nucleotidase SurE [Mangrovibacterium sp.]
MGKPLILISNDDGINAKGINELVQLMKEHGDIVVVAPDSAMSGMSSALTSEKPLRATLVKEEKGCKMYACSGTPVDCVKLAFNELLDKKPDYVLAGINHGANTSVSVLYSGTMGAALEGCVHEVPSIALSLCDHDVNADFSYAIPWVNRIFNQVIQNGLPKYTCLNVNFPKGEVNGVEVCRQAEGKWENEMDHRVDTRGRSYFWLTGQFYNMEPSSKDTDLHVVGKRCVSVVPIKIDMTDYTFYNELRSWDF